MAPWFKLNELKALSYARAAAEFCPHEISTDLVIDAFKEVVGLPGQEVAQTLVERFELQEKLLGEWWNSVSAPPGKPSSRSVWGIMNACFPIPRFCWIIAGLITCSLLKESRKMKYQIGLATMSTCRQA